MAITEFDAAVATANRRGKPFSVVRQSNAAAGSPEASRLLVVKWDPEGEAASNIDEDTKVTAATCEQQAAGLVFLVNAAADTASDPVYATEGNLAAVIDKINGNASTRRRWRAGLGDVPLTSSLSASAGTVRVAQNVLLGEFADGLGIDIGGIGVGLAVFAGCGVDLAMRGLGTSLPQYLNTGYEYNVQQYGRAGGIQADQGEGVLRNKASKFTRREAGRMDEVNPSTLRFTTHVENINCGVAFTGTKNWRIFDINGIQQYHRATAQTVLDVTPGVAVVGPAFVEVRGTGPIVTEGPLTVTGELRVS